MSTSKDKGTQLDLTGMGAAYIRVSDDQSDTQRQYAAIHAFEQRHEVTIPQHHWFKDEGWARDQADKRPDFQRLMKLAEAGRLNWIVVDRLDRFGTKDAHQLVHYLYRLRECGCKLYDGTDREWTAEDIATIITAVVEGEKSKGEQTSKSHRVLGAKAEYARAGEWQGGPVPFGLDVACYPRQGDTQKELWRVVLEGLHKRLKVYPDRRKERFDDKGNFPNHQEETEVLRLTPSKDEGKLAAAVSVFKRYAAEAVNFTALAKHLNDLGWTNNYGGLFQGQHIERMLRDTIYIGYYAWNRSHFGKFHRYKDGQTVLELNYDEKVSPNERDDWVKSGRLFPPLVDLKTWNAVQRKLEQRTKRPRSPSSAEYYLAGLLHCANCGGKMVAGHVRPTTKFPRKDGHAGPRQEYHCGTYQKAAARGRLKECNCLRNGVFQDILEPVIDQWLEEVGHRLDLLTEGLDAKSLTDRLDGRETEASKNLADGIDRLERYLMEHHPEEYHDIRAEEEARLAEGEAIRAATAAGAHTGPVPRLTGKARAQLEAALKAHKDDPVDYGPGGFLRVLLDCYRANFDPAAVDAELARAEAELADRLEQWRDLPKVPAVQAKARERLKALGTRIDELKRQKENVAEVVSGYYRELDELQLAVIAAKSALRAGSGERALRQKAAKLRDIIDHIDCTFTATGQTGSGWGKKNSQLATVTIYPVAGDVAEFSADSKGTLLYSSAHSRI
jgi:DNA invertase Pin-like site-specific DNA recombinase